MRRYRELLATPGVVRLTAAVVLSRVATSMLNLALLVATTQRYGYASAGLLLMVFAVATAVVGPARGRLADRHAPRGVMLWLLGGHTAAWVGMLAGLVTAAPLVPLCVATVVLGVTLPPAGPVVRGLWPTIVPAERLSTAYAFDAALNTATFVAGPMFAGALLLFLPAPAAVAVIGVVRLTGDLMVAVAPALRRRPAGATRPGGFFGPLTHPGVRLLLGMIGLDAAAFGCLEVAAVATMSGGGSAGLLTSSLALGGVVSGLGYGARTWPGNPRAQLVVLHATGAVLLGVAGLAGAVALLLAVVVYAGYGLVHAPAETLQQLLIGEASADHQRIEAFAWVVSVMWAGFGIGTTIGGQLVTDGDPGGGLYAAAAMQALVAIIALTGMRGTFHTAT